MNKKLSWIMITVQAVLLLAIILLMTGAAGYVTDASFLDSVWLLEQMEASVDGGPFEKITLPHSFRNLEPRTKVIVRGEITPEKGEEAYIKTVYAPAKIFVDEKQIFAFGLPEDYPPFMKDPATEVHIIPLGGNGEKAELRMEFKSPIIRDTLTVHPPMIGMPKNVIFSLFHHMALPLLFSIMQIVGGVCLLFVALCISFMDKKGISFFWLGLFSLAAGCWAFGENNFTSLAIKNPTLLYLMAFTGLFTFIVPLLHFIRTIIDFENPQPIRLLEFFFSLSAAAALLLQLTGDLACARSMYYFHVMLPPALILLTGLTIHEAARYKNVTARRFCLPLGLLALSSLLELVNYRFPRTYLFSSLFQAGILVFLLLMGVTAGLSIKDSMDLKNKRKELAFEKGLMEMQQKEQQSHSQLLAQHEQLLRQQRHDLRHHLEAIRGLADQENQELQSYLQTLMDNIPAASRQFCENAAVNAILCHYEALCRQKGISLSLHLVIPEKNPTLPDSSLCVIFGNLLENAVEACERMEEGEKFIKLNSSLQYDLLTITMDNSFNGRAQKQDGRYRSAKREDFGIGIQSIQTLARKAGGDADFKSEGKVFLSSVYVHL